MSNFRDILKKYWGYPSFRPLQEEIIESVVDGNDTLALLPTGGGKSITFQIPALASEGTCIVVTPLIALMKDQVENLKKQKIKAVAIYSGLSKHEIDIAFDNCTFGNVKFLYVSPERLSTEIFITKIQQMKINYLAIDEAHCISQWGYDFRPSYLKIAAVREYLPDIPVIAVTATATPEVVEDIQTQLLFKKKNVLQKSFERKNLYYIVRKVDDKAAYLLRIIKKTPGTGVIYVRNRKKTKEIAHFLRENQISADYYHAGLDNRTRDYRQKQWKSGACRVIVSTNAFGMGIDKANVRFVIHLDIPDSLEAYFQEAGRGGRDGKRAYAVLLYNGEDVGNLKKRIKTSFPERDVIKQVYHALGNYYQIPIGSGKGRVLVFKIFEFAKRYNLQVLTIFSALKFLQTESYIELTEEFFSNSKIHFIVSRDELYKFQIVNKGFDAFIKIVLRTYTGVFTDYVAVDEDYLAAKAGGNVELIKQYLIKLSDVGVINYIPRRQTPFIIYSEERLDQKSLIISKKNYDFLKDRYTKQVEEVINYTTASGKCRSRMLLEYFGQKNAPNCGHCDYCKNKNELNISEFDFSEIQKNTITELQQQEYTIETLCELLSIQLKITEEKILKVFQWMIENKKLKHKDGLLSMV